MPKNGISQWGWTDLEELLQCPVCLDIPDKGIVEQCKHGHHICANCKRQLESCPLCKSDFYGTRNFVVEELIRHFEILKNTMLLNDIVKESKPKKKSKKQLNANARVFLPITPARKVNTPSVTKGAYQCRVAHCDALLPAARLLNHVRTCHSDILTEAVVDISDIYSHDWEIQFRNKKPINSTSFVLFIRGMGLVFLTIEILRSGQLVVAAQMAVKFAQAQNFKACIQISGNDVVHAFTTRLVSVRDNIQAMLQRKVCCTLNKNQLRSVCTNRKFNCKLELSRFNQTDGGLLTIPNQNHVNFITAVRASLVQEQEKHRQNKIQNELHKFNTPTTITLGGITVVFQPNAHETEVNGRRKNKKK